VDSLANLLSDSSFTQQLLTGLGGVDPSHVSITYALQVLQGKQYVPVNAAMTLKQGFGLSKLVAYSEVQRVNAEQEAWLLLGKYRF
jgi:hypothetical protein